jgi:hypothetical protein
MQQPETCRREGYLAGAKKLGRFFHRGEVGRAQLDQITCQTEPMQPEPWIFTAHQ